MSYYDSNYYHNPGPYYGTSDKGEPVPGWGLLPNIAGPRMVGVGQEVMGPPPPAPPPPPPSDDDDDGVLSRYGGWILVAALAGTAVILQHKYG